MTDRKKKGLLLALIFIVVFIYMFNNMTMNNAGYLFYRRGARLLAMLIVSVAVTISTSLFQSVVNNRILTPDLLGYSQLYVLIQTSLVFFVGSMSSLILNPKINFLLVSIIMIIFSLIIFTSILRKTNHNLYLLLLIGTVLNTLFLSVSSFIQMIIDPNEFSILQNSLIASFNNINTEIIPLATILIVLPIPWVIKNLNKFDVIQLGEDYASNLGINTKVLYTQTLVVISILVSVSTALVGPIVFLGMLVVNLARLIVKSHKHKDTLFVGILLSCVMVIGGQLIVDKVFGLSVTLPVLLNMIGGTLMISLIMKERTS